MINPYKFDQEIRRRLDQKMCRIIGEKDKIIIEKDEKIQTDWIIFSEKDFSKEFWERIENKIFILPKKLLIKTKAELNC